MMDQAAGYQLDKLAQANRSRQGLSSEQTGRNSSCRQPQMVKAMLDVVAAELKRRRCLRI